jgi:hypothetical protein
MTSNQNKPKYSKMKKLTLLLIITANCAVFAQTNPAITKWMQNTTTYGSYYTSGNSTPIPMTVLANCQQVRYDATNVYVNTTGIPAYPTGIFTGDGNTNLAGNQNAIYRIPLNPVQNTGTLSPTTANNIGIFINGVSLFDYRDGVAYSATATNGICGGPPPNAMCPGGPGTTQAWNRDAIPAEKLGFDCAKGHPAGTNYHHHQNPSAFKYDNTTSTTYSPICDLYDSEGLYTINTTQHSPLIGFAYDGFPIYGAYAYTNTNGTGAITRMKSGYQLKTYTNGLRTNGPSVGQTIGSQTFFLGYFKEDYEFVSHPSDPTYLDVHNGRFCVTPEYPNGIYCYFATVNADHSSAYPYVIGSTFYGVKTGAKVTTVPTGLSTFLSNNEFNIDNTAITVFPNPASEYITVQAEFVQSDLKVELINELGQLITTSKILQGSTLTVIETDTLYNGIYFVKISSNKDSKSFKIIISK